MAIFKATIIQAACGLVAAMLLFGTAPAPHTTAAPSTIYASAPVKAAPLTKQASLGGLVIGDSLDKLQKQLGKPARIDASEQGYSWYVYNNDYGKLLMFGVAEKRIVAQFSNSAKVWSGDMQGIKLGQTLKDAKKKAGAVKSSESADDYWAYVRGIEKTVLFIDRHDNSKITGILRISTKQISKNTSKPVYASKLQKPFEQQVFDLASAERKVRGIAGLQWDKLAAGSAREHSTDMVKNDYFNHNSLQGLSPFDRMEEQGIKYRRAAENIAAGYPNAIFAHYGWMNSKSGHREALLDSKLTRLGTGVAFGGTYQVYYTQNFYTPS